MGKRKPKPRSKYDSFLHCAKQAFKFLVTDHGFGQPELERCSREFLLTYARPPIQVRLVYEHADMPLLWLEYHNGEYWVYKGLQKLTTESLSGEYPVLPKPLRDLSEEEYGATVALWLGAQARLLKKYGQRFLAGDPSQLIEAAGA